jgi:hypothetical protein
MIDQLFIRKDLRDHFTKHRSDNHSRKAISANISHSLLSIGGKYYMEYGSRLGKCVEYVDM